MLENRLQFLDDKSEETVDSTLRALWLAAYGKPVSAEKAVEHPLPDLSDCQLSVLDELIEQRLNKIPLAYITGRQNFMGIELLSDKRALIPRKETEILGKKALEVSLKISGSKGKVNIIDLCCGCGNLGLALAYHNPRATVFASDICYEAVELTRDNISYLNFHDRVKAEQSDLFDVYRNNSFNKNTDLIVCNPPYISSFKVSKLDSEISANVTCH